MRGPEPRCLTNERPSECHTRGWGGLWGVLMTMVQAIVVMWGDKTLSSHPARGRPQIRGWYRDTPQIPRLPLRTVIVLTWPLPPANTKHIKHRYIHSHITFPCSLVSQVVTASCGPRSTRLWTRCGRPPWAPPLQPPRPRPTPRCPGPRPPPPPCRCPGSTPAPGPGTRPPRPRTPRARTLRPGPGGTLGTPGPATTSPPASAPSQTSWPATWSPRQRASWASPPPSPTPAEKFKKVIITQFWVFRWPKYS